MADPKKKNGWTPIANELLEQVYKLKLSGTQFKIIMVVWRFTYGFRRKEHDLSVTFISNAIDTDVRTIKRELNNLIDMKLIEVVSEATFNKARTIAFNSNYDIWGASSHVVGKMSPSGDNMLLVVGKMSPTPGGENITQENNNIKQNIKKDNNIVDLDEIKPTLPVFTESSFEMLCVEAIINSCLELYPNSKVPGTYLEKEKWAKEIEKMKRLDGRSEDEIRTALKFAVNDSFWKGNIRSAKKFREKFETLIVQSSRKKNSSGNGKQSFDEFADVMKGWLENE